MKKLSIYSLPVFLFFIFYSCENKKDMFDVAFQQTQVIQRQLDAIQLHEKKYNITDFGAISNDESSLCHDIINKVIETCSNEGGGMVVIPLDHYEGSF